MVAVEPERLAGPQAVEDRERLVEPLGADAGGRLLADVAEPLVVERPEADREHEPPTGQPVDGHRLPCELPRPAPGRREHERPEPDPFGTHRHRREHDPRVVHVARADGDRVVGEHAVPARGLGLGREVRLDERVAGGDHDPVLHRTIVANPGAGPADPR